LLEVHVLVERGVCVRNEGELGRIAGHVLQPAVERVAHRGHYGDAEVTAKGQEAW